MSEVGDYWKPQLEKTERELRRVGNNFAECERELNAARSTISEQEKRIAELEAIARPLAQGWHSYGNTEEDKLELLRGTLGIWHFSDAAACFRKYEPGNTKPHGGETP